MTQQQRRSVGTAAVAEPPAISFAEQLAGMDLKQRAALDRMQPKERAKVWADWLQRDDPELGASKILHYHGGEPRKAEIDAWALFDLVAGGGPNARTNEDGSKYAVALVGHIQRGTEQPPVARTAVERIPFPY